MTLDLLYFYALAHVTSFDVRWISGQTLKRKLFAPLSQYLQTKYPNQITILESSRVSQIDVEEGGDGDARVKSIVYEKRGESAKQSLDVDACVLAVGVKGLSSILAGSPQLSRLSPELTLASSLQVTTIIDISDIKCDVF